MGLGNHPLAKQSDQWHFFWQEAPCCRGHNTRTKWPGLLLKLFKHFQYTNFHSGLHF